MNKIALIAGLTVLIIDQITKAVMLKVLAAGHVAVLPFLNLVLVHNRGISFGMFNGESAYGPLALTVLSIIIIGILIVWLTKLDDKRVATAVCVVIAGAVGNVFDRIQFGAVIDFLDFHAFGWHYPAFNVADSAIVLGIAFILFDSIFLEPKRNGSKSHA